MDNMNEMGGETGKVAFSVNAVSYKVMEDSMTWYNNQIEREMGRKGATQAEQMNGRGEQERMPSWKKDTR